MVCLCIYYVMLLEIQELEWHEITFDLFFFGFLGRINVKVMVNSDGKKGGSFYVIFYIK